MLDNCVALQEFKEQAREFGVISKDSNIINKIRVELTPKLSNKPITFLAEDVRISTDASDTAIHFRIIDSGKAALLFDSYDPKYGKYTYDSNSHILTIEGNATGQQPRDYGSYSLKLFLR